jgi:urea transport system substrate-binding protein
MRTIAVVAAATLAITLAGCSNGSSTTGAKNSAPIPVGTVLDLTGPLNVYGIPKSNVTKLAVKDINAHGGILGRKIKLIELDSQSSNAQNVQDANQLVQDHVAAVFGGVTSPSREAMRPILDRAKILYVYNTVYEGGVCDANTLITGQSASQLLKPLIDYTVKNFGKRLYIVGADYSFGRISGQWVEEYAKALGATVVGSDYISLDSSDFGSTLANIQAQKPDAVVSLLVGANHLPFYREFATDGLNKTTHIVSATFGNGNEQNILTPAESQGVIGAVGYYAGVKNSENTAFQKAYNAAYGAGSAKLVTDTGMLEWNAWHLWATAVNKAGSLDRAKVLKVIQSGKLSINTPMGQVTVNGPTHHTDQNISLVEVKNGVFAPIQTFKDVKPAYEQQVCNLIKNPNTDKQFTP